MNASPPLRISPDLTQEQELREAGYAHVAGIDEVGRGPWAGPVTAAAVILPLERPNLLEILAGVRDSKQLSPCAREALAPRIREIALAVGLGDASAAEIDAWGIVGATRQAMVRAVAQLTEQVDALLIDHLRLPQLDLPQRALPKADARCLSVAAASIVAKVERDRLMASLDSVYPGYGFGAHKGYGTAEHRAALARLGPSPIHRMSWLPLSPYGGRPAGARG